METTAIKTGSKHVKRVTGLKEIPTLLLQGNKLQNAGFEVGAKTKITFIKGQIIITLI